MKISQNFVAFSEYVKFRSTLFDDSSEVESFRFFDLVVGKNQQLGRNYSGIAIYNAIFDGVLQKSRSSAIFLKGDMLR